MPVAVTPERVAVMHEKLKEALAAGHIPSLFSIPEAIQGLRRHGYTSCSPSISRAVLHVILEEQEVQSSGTSRCRYYTYKPVTLKADAVTSNTESIMPTPDTKAPEAETSQKGTATLEQLATEVLREMRRHNLTELTITADGQMLYKQQVVQQLSFSLD
jgi:hypothetical protein